MINRLSKSIITDMVRMAVEREFDLSFNAKTREFKYVSARMVCSIILRGMGFTFNEIGRVINRRHSTVIHYMEIYEHDFEYSGLREPYERCVNSVNKLIKWQNAIKTENYKPIIPLIKSIYENS